jgi:predicted AlkP superfamily pyrophosphatase or phosphodiesterase
MDRKNGEGRMRRVIAALATAAIGIAQVACTLVILGAATPPATAGRAALNLVLVIDGLRPDAITAEETPNLWRLRQEGVNFLNGHAVFPTVTRVNAAAIATGTYPARNGIFGNRIYVRAVDPNFAFLNDDHRNLLRLDEATGGRMVLVKSLGEILAERGKRLAAVSSGSTGQVLLLNPRAPKGVGVLINGYWEPARRVAFPDQVNETVLQRFGPAPTRGGAAASDDPAVAWTQNVLRDYVLTELKPDVVIDWLTEPDHIQHILGAGSPEARASIRAGDAEVGLLLKQLDALGLAASTNIIMISDRGFSHSTFGVNLTAELIKAGLKSSRDSDDVVIASSGQTLLLHVKDRDPALVRRIVTFLQAQDWVGVLFTAGQQGEGNAPVEGIEPGTFALELIHLGHAERAPDIVVTFPWSSAPGPHGMPGTDSTETGRATGPLAGRQGNHGSMSPWTVRNTFLAWGVDFKRATTIRTPVSNVDITPTLLALLGFDRDATLPRFDGRALVEAFAEGPDEEQVPMQTTTHIVATSDASYRAAIQISEVGAQRYIDKSWRVR